MDDAIDFDELDIGRKLGEGFYGEVFLGDYLGTAVAIKAMKGGGSGAGAGATQASFLEEARLLATLRHPSIIMWMGIASPPDAEDLYIVTEFAANGDLLSLLLRTDVDLSWRLRVRWLQEVARALLYLHSKRLIHRDVKAENVFLDDGYHAKLGDFGIASRAVDDSKRTTIIGTACWMAPEVLAGRGYDARADIFGYGVTTCEVLTRVENDPDVLERTQAFGVDPASLLSLANPGCPPAVIDDVALACCAVDPDERPDLRTVLDRLKAIEASLPADLPLAPVSREDGGVDETSTAPLGASEGARSATLGVPMGAGAGPAAAERGGSTRVTASDKDQLLQLLTAHEQRSKIAEATATTDALIADALADGSDMGGVSAVSSASTATHAGQPARRAPSRSSPPVASPVANATSPRPTTKKRGKTVVEVPEFEINSSKDMLSAIDSILQGLDGGT